MEDLSQPSSLSPVSPVWGRRVGTAVLFAVTLAVLAPIVWLAVWFLFMSLARSDGALLVLGYVQIALLPISVGVGIVLGGVLGLIQRGKALTRWLIGAALVLLLALIVNGGLSFLLW